jgi:hypothetical protein
MTPLSFGPHVIPPSPLLAPDFVLVPLGPEHNVADHAAWGSSIDHIRATPGFGPGDWGEDSWPVPMSSADNLADLEQHADEFRRGVAFAYTVLEPDPPGDVIGCVYVDPDPTGEAEAVVRSWVRVDRAALDAPLADAVRRWLADAWPLASARFPGR